MPPVYYMDQETEIDALNIDEPTQLSVNILENQYQVPMELIVNDKYFFPGLYLLWIRPVVEYMWKRIRDEQPPAGDEAESAMLQAEYQRVLKLFSSSEEATEAECEGFLDQFSEKVLSLDIGSEYDASQIRGNVNGQMQGVSAWLRLRVAAVCLVADCAPDMLFGPDWINAIPAERSDILEVKDRTTYSIGFSLAEGQGLFSKTLYNPGGKICNLILQYGQKKYRVQMPPYGMLRAIFVDVECRTVVSLKGNISCGDSCRAIVQQGTKEGERLAYVSRFTKPVQFPRLDSFLDASADEMGGAVILTEREMYSTVSDSLYLQKAEGAPLPIRCYRSGNQWARLYADGHLESNLVGHETLSGVVSVAEDADRGLLVYADGRAVDFRNNRATPVSEEAYCERMMDRFSDPECFETVETQLMQFYVTRSGELRTRMR